ncbi:hypothetical protein K2X30_15295 [bacterium]|jgi:hypothetical protein|nr:hypothetical protein [bacterium]
MHDIAPEFKLDKQKYLTILKTQGLPAAITALHHDKEKLEFETFEGQKGYQRALWDYQEEVREFSRQLWDHGTENP